jgi:hypothetical protein
MSGRLGPAIAVLAVLVVVAKSASTQTVEPTNSALNPYRAIYDWAKMPGGEPGARRPASISTRMEPASGLPSAVALLRCRPS